MRFALAISPVIPSRATAGDLTRGRPGQRHEGGYRAMTTAQHDKAEARDDVRRYVVDFEQIGLRDHAAHRLGRIKAGRRED